MNRLQFRILNETDHWHQWPAKVTHRFSKEQKIRDRVSQLKNGDIYNLYHKLVLWWEPQGDELGYFDGKTYSKLDKEAIGGAYFIPTIGEISVWSSKYVCETPNRRVVHTYHPDSWLNLLGLLV